MKKNILFAIIGAVVIIFAIGIYKTYNLIKHPGEAIVKGFENMSEKDLDRLDKQLVELCKSQQPKLIKNCNDIKVCKEGGTAFFEDMGFTNFKIKGASGNNCIIEKQKYDKNLKADILAVCEVPIPIIDEIYELYSKYIHTMCDSDSDIEHSQESLEDKAKNLLIKYCKDVSK